MKTRACPFIRQWSHWCYRMRALCWDHLSQEVIRTLSELVQRKVTITFQKCNICNTLKIVVGVSVLIKCLYVSKLVNRRRIYTLSSWLVVRISVFITCHLQVKTYLYNIDDFKVSETSQSKYAIDWLVDTRPWKKVRNNTLLYYIYLYYNLITLFLKRIIIIIIITTTTTTIIIVCWLRYDGWR